MNRYDTIVPCYKCAYTNVLVQITVAALVSVAIMMLSNTDALHAKAEEYM